MSIFLFSHLFLNDLRSSLCDLDMVSCTIFKNFFSVYGYVLPLLLLLKYVTFSPNFLFGF